MESGCHALRTVLCQGVYVADAGVLHVDCMPDREVGSGLWVPCSDQCSPKVCMF